MAIMEGRQPVFRIEYLSDENKNDWAVFCLSCKNAWYWHTIEFQEFIIASYKYGTIRNMSFIVYYNDALVAVVPLLICELERIKGIPVKEIVYSGWANPYPAISTGITEQEAEGLTSFIFDHISSIAKEVGVARAVFSIFYQQIDLYQRCLKRNILLNQPGYLNISEHAQVVDLSEDINKIESSFRKRFMRYIRANQEKIDIEIITDKNISQLHCDECLDLSGKDSSQEWPAEKMPYLYSAVVAGQGILVHCRLKESQLPVGYLFVVVYKGYAFDFAVAVNDEYKDLRISHAMKLAAIRFLKAKEVKSYELGIATFGSTMHRISTEKRRAITYFKNGFANNIMSMFIAEKYYDREYLLAMARQRIELLEKDLFLEEGIKDEEKKSASV